MFGVVGELKGHGLGVAGPNDGEREMGEQLDWSMLGIKPHKEEGIPQ